MKILLLTPPITQLNTPYPATAYLTGFLRSKGFTAVQKDPAIDLIHELFAKETILEMGSIIEENYEATEKDNRPEIINYFLENCEKYANVSDSVLRFLRGLDPSLALRISSRRFLPEGPSFKALDQMEQGGEFPEPLSWAFGKLGTQDKAKYLSSLFLDDLAAAVKNGVDPHFELSRYGEKLAASNPSFDDLYHSVKDNLSLIDEIIEALTEEYIEEEKPDAVAITLPFPGNVYSGLKIAQKIKEISPDIKIILGGGYVNTELRSLTDERIFEFVDYISLDDGERPILNILGHIKGEKTDSDLLRTYVLENGRVSYKNHSKDHDIPHKDLPAPTYDGLDLSKYLSVFEMLNPMHRIWSDGRWNKLTLAHGCYWAKCSFCDISLDYIKRYDEAHADVIIDRMVSLIEETGQSGFHFVDEAAPPKILFAMAKRLIERDIKVTWWGNIRFEKSFTPKMCRLLAESGCVAVSGGLEVASDRLLKLMNKGVTVEQVAKVTKAFSEAGVLVHAYLMYGFPTQTEKETVEALDRVRQLFENGCIQSGYWHRFAATVHAPIGIEPEKFGVKTTPDQNIRFSSNDIDFHDPLNVDHDRLGKGLKKALYNFMHSNGFEFEIESWFDFKVEKSSLSRNLVRNFLKDN